jgi:3',5'-cyclic AMP phosphodiesterase CpdA
MTLIAQISDTHLMGIEPGDDRAPKRVEWLGRCVQDINGLNPKPDAVIHTGDMSQHGNYDEFILARKILNELNMPLYVTPGNRDSRAELRDVFSQDGYFQSGSKFIHYAVVVDEICLVAIDSVCEGSRMGELCDDRLAALDETLCSTPDIPTVLFMHHPPFEVLTSREPFQFGSREVVDKFARILRRHPQITQIFCGHAHRSFASELADTRASTAPSVAIDLRLGDISQSMNDTPVYQLHRFFPGFGFYSETRFVM